MQQTMWPVDVISLSGSDGKIRPLRIRAVQADAETIVGNVCDILCTKENNRIGAESRTFLCRVCSQGGTAVLELKLFLRTHSWYMSRPGS